MSNTKKAKRELKNIDFSKETSHIALVGPAIGGPANGADYALVMKGMQGVSTEFVQKIQSVKVTLELPEFLRKFFGLYYEDAEVLARIMGYVPEVSEEKEEWSYEDWIQEKVEQFEIVKSVEKFDSIPDIFNALGEDKFIELVKFQSKVEKSIIALDKFLDKSTKVVPTTKAVTSTESSLVENKKVEAPASVKLEKSMDDNKNVEMVEKSQLDGVLAELTKAKEAIEVFKAKEKEAISKARKAKVVDAVKDEAKAEVLFKSLENVSDEQFDATIETLKSLASAVEKSALFEEKGAAVESSEPIKESGVMKALKAQKLVK